MLKKIKFIAHPHSYIVFFVLISIMASIPNGLGWRHDMHGLTTKYLWLYILYIVFYLLGFYFKKKDTYNAPKIEIDGKMISSFHLIFIISFLFFIAKFIYLSGIPIFSNDRFLRTKLSSLGGFVDFPAKLISLLGIIAYYFYIKRKNSLYLFQFFLTIILNILFAERSLLVFTIIGASLLYVNFNEISKKVFKRVIIIGCITILLIGWIQIIRHGGKNHLNLSGQMSGIQVASWVVHGDLTGSQKFGAFMIDELKGQKLNGRYTLGIYLSLFIPNYKDHGASYLQKNYYTKAKTAQSVAIPYSYYIDLGYFGFILPFIIGYISRLLYDKFKSLTSPMHIILYLAFYFNLLWSVRAGNFPIDPKLIYFYLAVLFIFNPKSKIRINNEVIQLLRLLFLCSLVLSTLVMIWRW